MRGMNEEPLMMPDTILPVMADYVDKYAREAPEREAVVFGDQRLTYRELNARVIRCAKALVAQGVQKGDCIAVLSTPRTEYWVIFLAATRVGALWLGLNPKYRLPEYRYVLEDAKPRLVFAMAEFEGRSYQEVVEVVRNDYDFIDQVIALTAPMQGTVALTDFLAQGDSVSGTELEHRKSLIDPLDRALLVYTSGSTGRPKGALLSHYGLCYGATMQVHHYRQCWPEPSAEAPRGICCFPINHVACVADTCCVSLVAGGTLIFQERFDPGLVLRVAEKEKVDGLGGVPTMLLMLLEHPDFDKTDLSSVNAISWGGAALPAPLIERLKNITPHLMTFYGMTETATHVSYTSADADLTELSETIGRPSPYAACRIVNDRGGLCEVGEQGELQVKGKYLFLGYLNRPDATREAYTADGWLHTGDVAYWRDNGTITLVGRMSDMFKSGGYNVYPREIEEILESHPAVQMAAVVGVPDARYQEVGAAYVIVSDEGADAMKEAEALRAYCKENLANYKVPKYFHIVYELPLLPVGKVNKVTLKKQALEQVQL